MDCLACGQHRLNYIHCDRWDCPLLVAREVIERATGMPQEEVDEDERDGSPPDEDDDEVAVDWDENGYWPSENDDAEEEGEE